MWSGVRMPLAVPIKPLTNVMYLGWGRLNFLHGGALGTQSPTMPSPPFLLRSASKSPGTPPGLFFCPPAVCTMKQFPSPKTLPGYFLPPQAVQIMIAAPWPPRNPSLQARNSAAMISDARATPVCSVSQNFLALGEAFASATPPGKLRVQIQPVALRAGGNADGSAKPASVEVAIVSA
jgi:hypothetical protein